ncbi:MAG: Zn-dependent hydrolase [Longimicrobiales bacterium]
MATQPPQEAQSKTAPQPISRRAFNRAAAGVLVGGALDLNALGPSASPADIDGERVNRILSELQRYGGTGDGGTTRLAYSNEDLAAREYVSETMSHAGLDVSIDLAGNLVGRKVGTSPGAKPVVIGSHIDSVPNGGSYDGQVGSAGALEVALSLHDQSIELRHPLEVIIFQNEEGGKTGSRALVGRVEPFELELETASGFTIHEGIRRLGGNPERLAEAQRQADSVHGFLELHIEQGGVLEAADVQIGVVEGIVGIRRWTMTVEGVPNHAGTTPMDQRRDALVASSELTVAVHQIALETPGRHVATVGRIEAVPGAPNVVPGRVVASLEIRDLTMDRIGELYELIREAALEIDERRNVTTAFDRFYESLAAPTDPRLRDIVESSAEAGGYRSMRMPSGAGHDAQSMAEVGPIGMIFVPSDAGVSHSPKERTAAEDVKRGTHVLFESLLRLDQSDL